MATRAGRLAALAAVTIDKRTGELMTLAVAKDCFLAMLNGGVRDMGDCVLIKEEVGKKKWTEIADITEPWVLSFWREMKATGHRIAALPQ